MPTASLLLVTSLLAPGASFLPTAVPATPVAAAQQRATMAPTSTGPSHRLGFGGSLAVSNYGVGGSTRYWFTKHVGLSMAAGWYRPRQYGYTTYSVPSSSTVMAMPSVMVTFGATDPNREVSLRPYFGVGVSYLHATTGLTPVTGLPSSALTYSSTTPVGLGGTELFFRDHPNFTLSVDGVYYRLPVQFVNRAYVNGLNFQVSAHFYLK